MPHRSRGRLDPPDALRHRVQRIMAVLTCGGSQNGNRRHDIRISRRPARQLSRNVGKTSRVARVTGLEPATSGVTGRRSNQLSYTRTRLVGEKYGGGGGVSSAPRARNARARQIDVDASRRCLWHADSMMTGKLRGARGAAASRPPTSSGVPRDIAGCGPRCAAVPRRSLLTASPGGPRDIAGYVPRCAAVPRRSLLTASGGFLPAFGGKEWALTGSNRRPTACKAAALPLS